MNSALDLDLAQHFPKVDFPKVDFPKVDYRKNFIIEYINYLPEDMVEYEIKEFIPEEYYMFTNKHYYALHHSKLKKSIRNYENYIRDTIRRDNDFVFKLITAENYKRWLDIKQYVYKNILYKNYIYFVNDFCIENDSNKCRLMLSEFLAEHGLCQNQHKKNVAKHIRWNS